MVLIDANTQVINAKDLSEKLTPVISGDKLVMVDSENSWKTSLVDPSLFKWAKGDPGNQGNPGTPWAKGDPGKSAYQVWLDRWNYGTVDQFLASLVGAKGDPGIGVNGSNWKSAYQLWIEAGNSGTVQDFLSDIKGVKGDPGEDGVTFDYRGDYIPWASYDTWFVVLFNGASYVSRIDGNSSLPTHISWGKIAEKGQDWEGVGDMLKSENLAGLTDYQIARSFLDVYSKLEVDDIIENITIDAYTKTESDAKYAVISHNHTLASLTEKSYNSLTDKPDFSIYEVKSAKWQANGYAPLDSGSLIPSIYLPSYVDDVIDVALYADLPVTGEAGKIYNVYGDTVSLNWVYRWGGAAYSKISSVSDAVWGHITGTLADQADLVSALAGKAAASHTHVLADLPNISQNHFLGRNSSWSGTIEVLSATQTRSALSVYSQSEIDWFTVKLTGNQTIAGVKTFSSAPVVPDASFSIAKTTWLQTALDGTVKTTGDQGVYGSKTYYNSQVFVWDTAIIMRESSAGTYTWIQFHTSLWISIWEIKKSDNNKMYLSSWWLQAWFSNWNLGIWNNNPTTRMSFWPLVDNTKPTLALYESAWGWDYYWVWVSSWRLSFWEWGAERMSIVNWGAVWIWTTSPSWKLDVIWEIYSSWIRVRWDWTDSQFRRWLASEGSYWIFQNAGAIIYASSWGLAIWLEWTNSVFKVATWGAWYERLRIDTDGTITMSNNIRMSWIPTSASWLPAGSIWCDTGAGNVLKRV